jgi:Spy/CpxP family protein refolding chaperone
MSVTAAGVRRDRKQLPRRGVLAAVLAISVALNLCFVAGALWTRYSPAEPGNATDRYRKLEAALNLNDQQRAAFEAYVAATRARTAQLRRDIEPLLDAAWAEIGKAQPDEALIIQRLNDASARWRGSQREAVEATLALLATLDQDQREKFVADERERRAAMRRRRIKEGH